LKAALIFTPVGLLCGALIAALGEGWPEFPLYTGIATFLTTFVVWWLSVARPRQAGVARGAVAGLISGLVAHPVTWYILICFNWALIALSIRDGPSAGQEPMTPLSGLLGALVYSLASIVVMGWITIPVGAVVGALVGGWQARAAAEGAHSRVA
jgi:hypothetical protein